MLVMTPGATRAQTRPPAPPPADIVVTGRGLPLPPGAPAYGTITLSRDQLASDASGRIENALRDVAGVQQFRRSDSRSANPSAQGVTLRALGGNAASRALVLLDGVPIADPFFGHIPFNALDASTFAGARITRGAGTGAFGAGAVAGVVELASATRADLRPVSATVFYGSDNAVEASAAVSPALGAGFATLSGRVERGDGFFTTPAGQRTTATARARYRGWSVGLRGVAPVNAATELHFRATLFDDRRTLRFAGADSATEGADASLRLIHHGTWQVEAIGYVQARNFSNVVVSATSFRPTLNQRRTPATGLGGKVELRPPLGGRHTLRLGVDIRRTDGRADEEALSAQTGAATARRSAGGDMATIGGFVEDDWQFRSLVVTGGVRLDRWVIANGFFNEASATGAPTARARSAERRGTEATGRLGFLARALPGVAIRGAAYSGFRLPTLNELYRSFVVFPITTRANAALAPERLRGAEIGLELMAGSQFSLSATAFYNRLAGAIANVTIGANLRERRNLGAINALGIELSGHAKHGAVSLDASYAYTDARVDDAGAGAGLNGLRPAQTPRHSVSATLGYAAPRGVTTQVTVRYTGQQFEDDLQLDSLPPALTVDGLAGVSLNRQLRLVARAENLFDERVVTRNVGGSLDLGTPRRLWLGLRFSQGPR
ncbi:MAG: TonB-dependent receptor [Sphingomonas sp.]